MIVGVVVGQILLACEEPNERPTHTGSSLADRPDQHGVSGFERIEYRSMCDGPVDVDLHFGTHAGQRSQVMGQPDPDHESVCTSTEYTAGRSRTIGSQLSPPSAEAYTCPPVVPK